MKPDALLTDYVQHLSDEDLNFLYYRFQQRLINDVEDISTFLSQDKAVDRWLATSQNVDELFAMIDTVGKFVEEEFSERNNAAGN